MIHEESRLARGERLWAEYQERPSPQLRAQLVEHYRPLAHATVRRLCLYQDEDVEQVAMVGLVKAVDRFEPTRAISFSSFAVPTIAGEVRHYLRDHSRLVRSPRALQALREAVRAKERELTRETGYVPSLPEVAAALDRPMEHVLDAIAAVETGHPCSLDTAPGPGLDRPSGLHETVGEKDRSMEALEARIAWAQLLRPMGAVLQQVIELRYFDELSQKEVGERLGLSQMHISRLERRALAQLRDQGTVP